MTNHNDPARLTRVMDVANSLISSVRNAGEEQRLQLLQLETQDLDRDQLIVLAKHMLECIDQLMQGEIRTQRVADAVTKIITSLATADTDDQLRADTIHAVENLTHHEMSEGFVALAQTLRNAR